MDFKKILFKTSSIDVESALPDSTIFCSKDGKIQWINDKTVEDLQTSKMHLLTSNVADFIENAQNIIKNAVLSKEQVIAKLMAKEVYFMITAKEIEEGYVLTLRSANSSSCVATQVDSSDTSVINYNKNAFLLKLANDFKSPLQSIVGFSQAMSDGLGGQISEQQDKYIRIIKKNSSELMYFVNKLMELSQTELEIKSPDLKIFDIISLINIIVKFNEHLYKDKDLNWSIRIQEGLKNTITSDEVLIKTIIQNILEVVLKSIDMGDIVISLSTPEEEFIKSKNLFGSNFLMINISSNSLLLSESDLEHMFDPYKIIDTTNRKNLLRAITLACVKNQVQSLNGLVWVESQILKNTSFNILIPQGRD